MIKLESENTELGVEIGRSETFYVSSSVTLVVSLLVFESSLKKYYLSFQILVLCLGEKAFTLGTLLVKSAQDQLFMLGLTLGW